MERNRTIIRTSFVGIAVNALLATVKLVIGILSKSIAVTLDAVNNFSDTVSSLVTIVGARVAGKQPDKQHPFGHGRVEYLSAGVIGLIVLYAGITALIESVKKILDPVNPDFSPLSLAFVAVAVFVKLFLGRYFVRTGKSVNSNSLIASGNDALMDSAVSLSTLAAAVVFLLKGVNVEGYLGAVISLLMIRSGIGVLRETISQILGERPDYETSQKVKQTALSFPEVKGVYDLVLHSYGPDRTIGSFHIEVPDSMTAPGLDKLERDISEKIYAECGVIITGISIYSSNDSHDGSREIRNEIRKCVMGHEHVLQMHGFYLDPETKTARFDIVVGFDAPDRQALYDHVVEDVREMFPDYTFSVVLDSDTSD